jgi:hypothetical protein
MTTEIKITIKNCKECPFFKISNSYSSDGYDKMDDWFCTKALRKRQSSS